MREAEYACLASALVLGAIDVHCWRQRRPLVTDYLRRPLPLAFLLALTLHAVDVLGPFDPFRAVARLIPQENK